MTISTALLLAAAAAPVHEDCVYRLTGAQGLAYVYEHHVTLDDGGQLIVSHLTREPRTHAIVINETAQVTNTYALRRFDVDNRQQGYRGSATVSADGRRLDYELRRDSGRVVRQSETVDAPVVTGPSLRGFIFHHWDRLASGEKVDVRMIAPAKTETSGFRIALHSRREGRTAFSVTPTNWLMQLAVAPLTVAFDSASDVDGHAPWRAIGSAWGRHAAALAVCIAGLTPTATPAQDCVAPPLEPAPCEMYLNAVQAFREHRYAAAYGRFVRLADAGHAPSARLALLMYDQGPQLFGGRWYASPHQQRRWNAIVINHSRDRVSVVDEAGD